VVLIGEIRASIICEMMGIINLLKLLWL